MVLGFFDFLSLILQYKYIRSGISQVILHNDNNRECVSYMISTEAVHDMNGTLRITNIHINYNKLMRKTLLSLLAFFSLSAGAQTAFTSGDFSFSTTSPTTVEVTKYLKNELSAAIPEIVDYDGHTYTVTAIGE